ncbi:MAG: orc1/cdc6 family replication initiation protein [Prevotella sp.]|nr:orc1/cdc6 family replication initiation protein [Prevotella sp.]
MNRPFVYGYLAEKENFIDREEDRRQLKNFLGHGINVMLISPRRWGKSSLVKMAMGELMAEDHDVKVCYIDAFKVRTEEDFYNKYATAVIDGVFDIQPLKKSAEDILDLPERIAREKGIHVIVCIDEFQQLALLPEWKTMESLMRSVWQHHQHANYCLYGSKRHMMMDIFNNSNSPFYRFGQVLFMKKIEKKHWIPYIQQGFEKTSKAISAAFAERICEVTECHSWYVQQLSFFIWADTIGEVDEDIFNRQLQTLIDTNAPQFESDITGLAPSQLSMLVAIASGEQHLSAKEVVSKYGLGGAQTIAKNKKAIVSKDIVELQPDGTYHFVDPIFFLWFKQQYNINQS